jgi:hypothetical protein
MALKPLKNPVIGTYWKTHTDKYEKFKKNNPKMVTVVATERKYARMGFQECFVSFVPAVDYATMQPRQTPYRMEHGLFMDLFNPIPDEELSNVLGLEILANYG